MNARKTLILSLALFSVGVALPIWGANTRTHSTSATPSAIKPAPATSPAVKTNPLLPPAVPVDGFFIDLSLVQKMPAIVPHGFEPAYSAEDWKAYRAQYGAEADDVGKLKSTAAAEFAEKLLKAAAAPEGTTQKISSGFQRLLLLRAATIGYRNKDGFPIADKAIAAYQAAMDKKSAAQVGALWTLANAMARTSTTPKEDRIRYDAIAARANMQLAQLLLDADQVGAAESIIKQIGYHEGWLKKDAATRGQIAQVRAEVKQAAAMMDYLATQYQPAIHNDVPALTMIYLYGRYVKGNAAIVSDLPGRVPNSSLSELATALDAAGTGANPKPEAAFAAAEKLRTLAVNVPDVLIRQRTLYAAMQLYDIYLTSAQTERERVNRTLARIAREGVISDGAHRGHTIDPFAVATATMPATQPGTTPASKPAMDSHHETR